MRRLSEERKAELLAIASTGEEAKDLQSDELVVLADYQRMLGALATPYLAASLDSVDRAKLIMPRTARQPLFARLIRPMPLMSLARGSASAMIEFESEVVKVRMQIEPLDSGYSIMGTVDQVGWSLSVQGDLVPIDLKGRFQFEGSRENLEGLALKQDDQWVILPSPFEADDDGI